MVGHPADPRLLEPDSSRPERRSPWRSVPIGSSIGGSARFVLQVENLINAPDTVLPAYEGSLQGISGNAHGRLVTAACLERPCLEAARATAWWPRRSQRDWSTRHRRHLPVDRLVVIHADQSRALIRLVRHRRACRPQRASSRRASGSPIKSCSPLLHRTSRAQTGAPLPLTAASTLALSFRADARLGTIAETLSGQDVDCLPDLMRHQASSSADRRRPTHPVVFRGA